MFAVSMDSVVRIHASSGTSGQPTVSGYTATPSYTLHLAEVIAF
jgi:phenylacetate-coenzyme A ligase PaaK-like adenylate-forming protein